MEAKADKMLDAAEAMSELNEKPADTAADLAEKYTAGSDQDVEAELEALKAELNQ
jgi:phage shock protein A